MVFKNLTISKEISSKAEANFIAVGSSVSSPYTFGDDIVIPYLDGILFSGTVSNTKKKQVNFNTSTQKTFWQISCIDDFSYLERELTETQSRFENELPSTILKEIIGSEWIGDIDDPITNPSYISYTPDKISKASAVIDILNQTGYEWRVRRPVYRLEIVGTTSSSITFDAMPLTLVTDELVSNVPSTIILISGDGKYKSTAKVTGNSEDTIDVSNTTNWDLISAGDYFIVTRHPVLDAKPHFDSSPVKNLTVNSTLFDFDYEEDMCEIYNGLCVNSTDNNGDTYVSYIDAIYEVISPGDWEDCTFIDNTKTGATPDVIIYDIDRSSGNNKIIVVGDNSVLNFTSGENINVNNISISIGSVSTSGSYIYIVPTTFSVPYEISKGDYILRNKIYVNDASRICSNASSEYQVTIGNEILTVTPNTTDNYLSVSSRIEDDSRPHYSGTLVRSNYAIGKDGLYYVSSSNPQEGSPVDTMGYLKISTIDSSTHSDTGLADRLASTKISTGTLTEITGSGVIPIKFFYKSDISGLIGNVPLDLNDVIHVNNFGETTGDTTEFKITSLNVTFDNGSVDINFGNRSSSVGDYLVNIISSIGRTS